MQGQSTPIKDAPIEAQPMNAPQPGGAPAPGETYSEQMQQWIEQSESKRGLFRRLLAPDPASPFTKRLAGYLIRFALLLIIPLLLAKWYLGRSLENEDFGNALVEQIRLNLGAQELITSPIKWMGDGFKCEELRIVGGPDTAYSSIDITGAFFGIQGRDVLTRPWPVNAVAARTANVVLHGGKQSDLNEKLKSRPTGASVSGFLQPGLEGSPMRAITIDKVQFTWLQGGSISDTKVRLTRSGDDHWEFKLQGGEIQHATLSDIKIADSISGSYEKGMLKVSDADLLLGESGSGVLNLSIDNNNARKTEASIDLTAVNFDHLLPSHFTGFVGGTVHGRLEFNGNVGQDGMLASSGTIEPFRANLGNLGLLNTLSDITENSGIRFLALNRGKIDFNHEPGKPFMLDLDSGATNLGQLRGQIEMLNGEFSGEVDFGVEDYVFRRVPELKTEYFNRPGETESWRKIPIKGKIEKWTEGLDQELFDRFLDEEG